MKTTLIFGIPCVIGALFIPIKPELLSAAFTGLGFVAMLAALLHEKDKSKSAKAEYDALRDFNNKLLAVIANDAASRCLNIALAEQKINSDENRERRIEYAKAAECLAAEAMAKARQA